jgi:hypothetical protein
VTHFLATAERPEGHRLEDLLGDIRRDLVHRMGKIVDDDRPEARHVLANDVRILTLLGEAIAIAEDSSRVLVRSFGPSRPGNHRIGVD